MQTSLYLKVTDLALLTSTASVSSFWGFTTSLLTYNVFLKSSTSGPGQLFNKNFN